MEAMPVVILWEFHCVAVKNETPLVYAVCIASYGCAEIASVDFREICLDAVETKHHVFHVSFTIRNHDADNAATEIGYADFHTLVVLEGIERG